MVDIEAILPLDPGMTEEEIDNVLDRPNYIARVDAGDLLYKADRKSVV